VPAARTKARRKDRPVRLSPRELHAVRREGFLTRYAVLGPVAFALAELPETGTGGTSLEKPCQQEHWGIVLRGEVSLAAGRKVDVLRAGTAFYVHPGRPAHRFVGDGPSALAGFVPIPTDLDVSEEALRGQGFEIVRRPPSPVPVPTTIQLDGVMRATSTPGAVDVELAVMGPWICSRTIFGKSSGYATDWCDLPHWGVVLSGNVGIHWENDLELLSPGDVYYCPAGPPGHRLEAPDGAKTLDYTPIAHVGAIERQADWRRSAYPPLLRDLAGSPRRSGVSRAQGSPEIRPPSTAVNVPV
jgi:uncharacterized cupin superfamily protein